MIINITNIKYHNVEIQGLPTELEYSLTDGTVKKDFILQESVDIVQDQMDLYILDKTGQYPQLNYDWEVA